MRIIAIALLSAAILAGCAASPSLPYQYATLKLIESERATPEQVIDRTERVAALLDADKQLTVLDLETRVKDLVGYSALPASDRLLIDALMGDLSYDLGVDIKAPLSDEHRADLMRRLEWIAQAAAMAD